MSDTFLAAVRDRLGIPDADASEETVLAGLDEALEEQPNPAPTATAETTAPAGTTLVENTVLDQLRTDATAGREAREQQIRDRREGKIRDAIAKGKIAPAAAATFRDMLDANEDKGTAVLDTLAENTIPVTEIGHSDTLTSADDAIYSAVYPATKEA